jgi:hypothetical protein
VKTPQIPNTDDGSSDFLHGGAIMPAGTRGTSALESAAPDSDLPDEEAPQSRYRYRLLRELLILAVAALVGFLLMPFLIWTVGHSALGPYNHGGPGGLLADFMSGLAHGSLIYWAVALGPYAFTLLVRFLYSQARGPR